MAGPGKIPPTESENGKRAFKCDCKIRNKPLFNHCDFQNVIATINFWLVNYNESLSDILTVQNFEPEENLKDWLVSAQGMPSRFRLSVQPAGPSGLWWLVPCRTPLRPGNGHPGAGLSRWDTGYRTANGMRHKMGVFFEEWIMILHNHLENKLNVI